MTDNVPKCDTFVAYDISPTFYIYAGREPDYRFFATQDWAIENGPSLRQKVVDCYRSDLAEWILVYQYGQSNIKVCLMRITSFIATMKNMIFRCSRENKNKRNVQLCGLHVSLLSVNLY